MSLNPIDLKRFAILLDVDGTILDIAPTPSDVEVPDSLRTTLRRVAERAGGALALVSGRPLRELDAIFAPLRLAAIGGHGAEIRIASDSASLRSSAPLDAALKDELKTIARKFPGVTLEDKGYSVAMHYRARPALGPTLMRKLRDLRRARSEHPIELLSGKAVIEVKIAGFNKGTAVRELMAHPPFVGRVPICIGDDVTDEDAFAVMPEFDGIAISVGRKVAGVYGRFQTPADVRNWLDRIAHDAVLSS